ncbi:MAG: response regulator transcription factor [Acidimicrobiia bacterium]
MTGPLRIVVVDDHEVVRRGLEQVLANVSDMELVGAMASGEEAVALVGELRPDVMLMDISMPGIGGIEATRLVCARAADLERDVHVIALTSFAEQKTVLAALHAGASGYLLKHATPENVIDAIRSAHAGEAPLDPLAARALLDAERSHAREPKLTTREGEVLDLVGLGLANKQIASQLGIRERTVKAHLTSIFTALGVQDRTQAALWARDHRP